MPGPTIREALDPRAGGRGGEVYVLLVQGA